MQVHPIEMWDLLNLLGLPREWTASAFLDFFDEVKHPNPSHEAMLRMARLFRSVERQYAEMPSDDAERITQLSRLKTRRTLRALRDDSSIPLRQLASVERRAAIALMRANTPIRHLVSRHTRALLRRYRDEGMLSASIADRDVKDKHITMSPRERELYDAVETYIATTYNQASEKQRSAVGFVMTTYRRRLASSVQALRVTLQRHLTTIEGTAATAPELLAEDIPDDETASEIPDTDELAALEREALALEESEDIERLLERIARCPPDSKLHTLIETLRALNDEGYPQVMVFTQFTDTMDFLREALRNEALWRLLCFSGRGGEVPTAEGGWRRVERDDIKRRFRDAEADILLCTDAAAEGLNFQFCGALVNYDMPWNPMRVEQRIGRIDRLGQRHATVRIANFHYQDTVEADVYSALRERIGSFETVVGRLQPILARLPGTIANAVLTGSPDAASRRSQVEQAIERQLRESEATALDIDQIVDHALKMRERPASPITMDDLDRIVASPQLMPPAMEIGSLGRREYAVRVPGMVNSLRVTTNPEYYEQHADDLEFWSPGNPLFNPPELLREVPKVQPPTTLGEILDEARTRQ